MHSFHTYECKGIVNVSGRHTNSHLLSLQTSFFHLTFKLLCSPTRFHPLQSNCAAHPWTHPRVSRPVSGLLTKCLMYTVVLIFTAVLCNKWWGDPYSIQSSLKLGKTKQLAKVISDHFLSEHWTCLMDWDVSKGTKPSALWSAGGRQEGRVRAQQLPHLKHTRRPRHGPSGVTVHTARMKRPAGQSTLCEEQEPCDDTVLQDGRESW